MIRQPWARPVYFTANPVKSALRIYQVSEPTLLAQNVYSTGVQNKESTLVYDVGAPAKNAVPVYVVNAWYRSADLPTPLIAYQPKGASDAATALVNKASPGTYNASGAVAWTKANGWRLTAGQQLSTGYTVAAGLVPYTIAMRLINNEITGVWFAARAGSQLSIRPNQGSGGNDYYLISSTAARYVYPVVGHLNGVVIMVHAAGGGDPILYVDGVVQTLPAWTNSSAPAPTLLSLMMPSSTPNNPTMQAFSFYTTALSVPQIATLTSLMQAL